MQLSVLIETRCVNETWIIKCATASQSDVLYLISPGIKSS